ncbi:hypothetical protein TRICHSKD4_4624 [Roseibium sp. TrichSKD4]|nr:hypothetical protein TRICHSKD4_4624 [Roseibium sp. TrichSKD4]
MQITRIDPLSIRGIEGEIIGKFDRYMNYSNSEFGTVIPYFNKLVLTSSECDGEHVPQIGHVGNQSHIKRLLESTLYLDLAAELRERDPNFEKAAAVAFAKARETTVCELVQMEVSLPGFRSTTEVRWYRYIRPIQFSRTLLLADLTLLAPGQEHLFALDTECRLAN